jgi:hypothetical protein
MLRLLIARVCCDGPVVCVTLVPVKRYNGRSG